MTSIAAQAAAPTDANAMAQELLAAYGQEQALAIATQGSTMPSPHNHSYGWPQDPDRLAFWSDVATLIRLETISDETLLEASQRARSQFRHMSHGHVLATHEAEQNPQRKAEIAAEIQRRGCA